MQSSLSTVPESVGRIRHDVAEMAAAAGVRGDQLDVIRLAVSEAATNIVLYAYGATDGKIHVTAELAGDELWVLIADDDRGIHAAPESRGLGLGLALMSEVCDGFSVLDRADGGTVLRLRFTIGAIAGRSPGSRNTASLPAIRRCRSRPAHESLQLPPEAC